jgi:hypothetical protein
MAKILRVFMDVPMYLGHDGLTQLAKEDGVNLSQLAEGEMVVFINHQKDKIKLYAPNNVLAYVRNEKRHPINLATISLIPKAFQGSGRIDYDGALKEVLLKELAKKVS